MNEEIARAAEFIAAEHKLPSPSVYELSVTTDSDGVETAWKEERFWMVDRFSGSTLEKIPRATAEQIAAIRIIQKLYDNNTR